MTELKVGQDSPSIVEKEYKEGLAYQKQMGFNTKWPLYERFKAGDQWPPATERTRNMPRPVFNFVKFILNHKVSSVLSESIKMTFAPEEVADPNEKEAPEQLQRAIEGADKFTKFAESTWENVDQDELNEDVLDDAALTGSGILHYYWDDEATGGITKVYKGNIAGEVIDTINCFWGNPQQKNVQKQPRIIISNRDMVESVKDEARANGVKDQQIALINPDNETQDQGYDPAKYEVTGTEKVTVLTKYWKQHVWVPVLDEQGQPIENMKKAEKHVFFCKVASGVTIKPATDAGFRIYPIAAMPWDKRKKSINGVGETEGLIQNQKTINLLIAGMIKNVQDTGWSKLLVKDGALQQQITDIPGEIIVDFNPPGQGDGIKYMQPGNIAQFAPLLVDKVMDFTRTLSGANEVSTGDPFTRDLNAAAIIAMQNAAKIPIDQIKKRFYRMLKDVGRIWEEFYKVKYNIERRVTVTDDDGNDVPMNFKGSDYAGIPFRLKIDVGAGSTFSESLMMATLDKLHDKGEISTNIYLRLAPKNAVPFADRMIKMIEEEKKSQPAPTPQDKPNISIKFETLPPTVQAQILAGIGVQVTPQDFQPQMAQPGQPDQIEQIISQMSPEQRAAFFNMPEEQQMTLMQQMMGGGMNG